MCRTTNRVKIPADAFTMCPACGSKDCLNQVSIDVYCLACGWDSSSAFVDACGLDDLIYQQEREWQRIADQQLEAAFQETAPKQPLLRSAV